MSGWRRRCGSCGAGVAETQYATASDMGEASLPYQKIHVRVSEHQIVILEKVVESEECQRRQLLNFGPSFTCHPKISP